MVPSLKMLQSFSIQVSAGQQGGGSEEQGRAGVPTLIKTLPTVLAASSTMRYNTSLYRTLVTGVRGHCPRVPAGGGRGQEIPAGAQTREVLVLPHNSGHRFSYRAIK